MSSSAANTTTIELTPQTRDDMKFVILGSGGVGKSAVTIQFIKKEFKLGYDPTIEDAYTVQRTVDNKPVSMSLLDTAGQEEFTAMRDQYMREGEGFILVYSITDASSFEEVKDIYEQLCRSRDIGEEGIPVCILGNKIDLEEERVISYKEGEAFAKQFAKCKFFETSAYRNINIENAFDSLVRTVRKERNGEFDEMEEIVEEQPAKATGSSDKKRSGSKKGFALFNSCGKQNAESDLSAFEGA